MFPVCARPAGAANRLPQLAPRSLGDKSSLDTSISNDFINAYGLLHVSRYPVCNAFMVRDDSELKNTFGSLFESQTWA